LRHVLEGRGVIEPARHQVAEHGTRIGNSGRVRIENEGKHQFSPCLTSNEAFFEQNARTVAYARPYTLKTMAESVPAQLFIALWTV